MAFFVTSNCPEWSCVHVRVRVRVRVCVGVFGHVVFVNGKINTHAHACRIARALQNAGNVSSGQEWTGVLGHTASSSSTMSSCVSSVLDWMRLALLRSTPCTFMWTVSLPFDAILARARRHRHRCLLALALPTTPYLKSHTHHLCGVVRLNV